LNYTNIFFNPIDQKNNEDMAWSFLFYKKGNVPPIKEAIKFSFEVFPEYLYFLNNSELPFGCHDWFGYFNYFFFKEYIPLNKTSNV